MKSSPSEGPDLAALREEEAGLFAAAASGISGAPGVTALDRLVLRAGPGEGAAVAGEVAGLTGYRPARATEVDGLLTIVLERPGCPPVLVREERTVRKGSGCAAAVFRVRDLPAFTAACAAAGIPCRPAGAGTVEAGRPERTGVRYLFTTGGIPAPEGREVSLSLSVPDRPYLAAAGCPDHLAIRLDPRDRAAAVLECLHLTGGVFEGSEYVVPFRSVNSVVRVKNASFALNFVSGTIPGAADPFLARFGPGVHHLAFATRGITAVAAGLEEDGVGFALPLTGSPAAGVRQMMAARSELTGLIVEYIERFDGFAGYFDPGATVRL
ncbi:hypothetical protein E2N92_04700 [Methanofollis formosanus]|uniref:VOC domain-containing protein n=1 Tax=Methanofollis formosanus TaxID=299308 RepID=A0A8G1A1M4_9EURY|nr:hypothetical protein [Methanofollis formosanus]QYZ78776.1 hypothetical protein E2N92_04700 [Methanofollis formosanus]